MNEMKFVPIYKEQYRSIKRISDEKLGFVIKQYIDYA